MMNNHGNRITQGQFSFLPDLTDAQITAQIAYALNQHPEAEFAASRDGLGVRVGPLRRRGPARRRPTGPRRTSRAR